MNRIIRALCATALAGVAGLVACSSGGQPSPRGSTPMSGGAADEIDVVYLTNKEVVRGKILQVTDSVVVMETEDGKIETISAGAVYRTQQGKVSYLARTNPPPQPAAPDPKPVAGSWFPRRFSEEPVDVIQIDWEHAHSFEGEDSPLGPIATLHRKYPDTLLFAPAGGKIVFESRRNADYHAHTFPSGFYAPRRGERLVIPIAAAEKDLPEAVAFVSPSLESKVGDRTAIVPNDAFYAPLRPLSTLHAVIARQPFAAGGVSKTDFGELTAFGLPRNDRTWTLFLADDAKGSHRKFMGDVKAAFGDTLLEPNFTIAVESADGLVVNRILVLPMPDASLDAHVTITLFTGSLHDPKPLAAVSLPPRQAIVLPQQPPATKADVYIQTYGHVKDVAENIALAYGTGRPGAAAAVHDRKLTADQADEKVSIDLTSRKEEEFPLVAWLWYRRSYEWVTTGGYMPPTSAAVRTAPDTMPKLRRYKWSDPIAHALPLLFAGSKPQTQPALRSGPDPAATVGTGMANGLIHEAFAREQGGGYPSVNNFVPTQNTPPTPPSGAGGSGLNNQTVVNITVPPPGGLGGVPGISTGGTAGALPSFMPSGTYLYSPPGYSSGVGPIPGITPGTGGTTDGSNFYNTSGQQVFNSQGYASQYYPQTLGGGGQGGVSGAAIDPATGGIQPTVTFRRQSAP